MRLERSPRARRRRAVALVGIIAGSALLAAGCLPLTPPPPLPPLPPNPTQECTSTLASAADYNTLFDLRSTEWGAADITTPIGTLPDGQFAWLFGDTYWGRPNGTGLVASSPRGFVRNSVVSQTSTCLTHRLAGTEGSRASLFPEPSSDSWYWPMSGWVDPLDPSRVYVVLLKVTKYDYDDNGEYEPFDFAIVGNRIATVDATYQHLLAPIGDAPPGLPDALPNSDVGGTTLTRPGFGEGLSTDGTYVYLNGYLNTRSTALGPRDGNYAARVRADDPLGTQWEFWNGTGWSASSSFDAWAPLTFSGDDPSDGVGPSVGVHPQRWGSGWLAVAEEAFTDTDIRAWTAPAPEGPWTPVLTPIGTMAPTTTGTFLYGARLLELPGVGPTLAWNINNDSFWAIFEDVRLYGPRFAAPGAALPAPSP